MREIVLDTETTGLSPADGHRVVEIGAIELVGHIATKQTFHVYLNPERDMPKEAEAIHGLSDDFLRDKPKFAEIADGFLDFIGDAPLVIHNASFDVGFLNAELGRAGKAQIEQGRAIDTVGLARRKFPGAPASLDALCRRFGVDNSMREKHGALLDSEILAEVYLMLIGGRQPGFDGLAERASAPAPASGASSKVVKGDAQGSVEGADPLVRKAPLAPLLTAEERTAHDLFVKTLGENAYWSDFS